MLSIHKYKSYTTLDLRHMVQKKEQAKGQDIGGSFVKPCWGLFSSSTLADFSEKYDQLPCLSTHFYTETRSKTACTDASQQKSGFLLFNQGTTNHHHITQPWALNGSLTHMAMWKVLAWKEKRRTVPFCSSCTE